MENQSKKKDKNDILKKTTSTNLWLRIFVGGFLIYLAYTLGIDLDGVTGKDLWILGGATVLFGISGLVIVGWSLYRLVKRDYYDPILDAPDDEVPDENADEENNSQ
ncbi:MAG: hypothetical protein IJZ76_10900 [Lachnospiraceae bacterium]|nr:hypothetical protein [Lachnospiraceae bacterium]